MTSLAAAISVDSRGPSGLYIITDSRITWAKNAAEHWDAGRKTFASRASPDIFGYCGDAYFVPIILGQVLSLFDDGLFPLAGMNADQRHTVVLRSLETAIAKVQTRHVENFSVFHGSRDGEFMTSRFRLWHSQYTVQSAKWRDSELELSQSNSYLAHVDGTGKSSIEKSAAKLAGDAASGTSRAAMYSFCQSLQSGADKFSGGPPQLVGIWRKGLARQFGFCWHGKSYVAGVEVPSGAIHELTRWFNHLFEVCDGRTGSKLESSKSHRASLAPRAAPSR